MNKEINKCQSTWYYSSAIFCNREWEIEKLYNIGKHKNGKKEGVWRTYYNNTPTIKSEINCNNQANAIYEGRYSPYQYATRYDYHHKNKEQLLTATISNFRKNIKKYLDSVSENFDILIINHGKDHKR